MIERRAAQMNPVTAGRIIESHRRATAVPLVAVSSVLLLSFVALAVDVGYIYATAAEMQRTADASALAGASGLLEGNETVRSRAYALATTNPVARSVVTGELNIGIGYWEARTRTFSPSVDSAAYVSPNAVHVDGTRSDLALFFAPVMGINTTDVSKEAIALVGSGRCAGIWGLEGITADGNIRTDSYDYNKLGGYVPGHALPNGDICSCEDIVANGGIEIFGDAMYGDGYAFIPSGTAYYVYGVIDDHNCGAPSFTADFIDAEINNDNATIGLTTKGRDPFNGSPWDLYVTGNDSLTLTGGTYYFTSVMIDGQATLNITGPTIMYVTGPAYFTGGGIFNVSQNPSDLLIYSSDPTLNMSGNAAFYGAVIAPQSDVVFEGTSDYYGTIVGQTLDFDGDTNIHVDESLVYELFGIESVAPILVK